MIFSKHLFPFILMLIIQNSLVGQTVLQSEMNDSVKRPEWLEGQDLSGIYIVSMVELMANPDYYDGKNIWVSGYLHLEFERNAIYLHRDDFIYGIRKNAIGLRFNKDLEDSSELIKFSDQYVQISGVFLAKENGFEGDYNGRIQKIIRIKRLKKRE